MNRSWVAAPIRGCRQPGRPRAQASASVRVSAPARAERRPVARRGDPPPAPFANRRGRGDPGARRQLGAFPGLARQRAGAGFERGQLGVVGGPHAAGVQLGRGQLGLGAQHEHGQRLSRDCDRSWRSSAYSCGASSPPGRRATSAAWPAAGPWRCSSRPGARRRPAAGDVLGQLAVQESQRIGARGGNDQEIVQGAQAAQPSALDGIEARNRAWRRVWWRPAQDGAASHLQRSDDSRLRYGSRPIPRAVQGRVARVAYHSVPISSVGPARDPLNFRNL